MTTIVFDGKILAADTRSTIIATESSYKCVKCGTHTNRCSDNNKSKIVINLKSKFRGETILAVATSGDSHTGNKFFDFLRNGEDIEEIVRINKLLKSSSLSEFRLLIIASENNYSFEYKQASLFVDKFDKNKKIAYGSGSKAALFSMEVFNCDARQAVKAGMVVDEGTGGNINFVDCSVEEPLKIEEETIADRSVLVDEFKKKIIKPKGTK